MFEDSIKKITKTHLEKSNQSPKTNNTYQTKLSLLQQETQFSNIYLKEIPTDLKKFYQENNRIPIIHETLHTGASCNIVVSEMIDF